MAQQPAGPAEARNRPVAARNPQSVRKIPALKRRRSQAGDRLPAQAVAALLRRWTAVVLPPAAFRLNVCQTPRFFGNTEISKKNRVAIEHKRTITETNQWLRQFLQKQITERKQGEDSLEAGGRPLFPSLARLRIICGSGGAERAGLLSGDMKN